MIVKRLAVIVTSMLLGACSSLTRPEKFAIGAEALDIITTNLAIRRGYVEGNKLIGNGGNAQIKSAGLIIGFHITMHLSLDHYKMENTHEGKGSWYAIGATHLAVSLWNIKNILTPVDHKSVYHSPAMGEPAKLIYVGSNPTTDSILIKLNQASSP